MVFAPQIRELAMAALEDGVYPGIEIGLWSGASLVEHIESSDTAALFALWNRKAAAVAPAPVARRDLDVLELGPWLGWLVLYDFDATRDDYRCRVFGDYVRRHLGMDMTNRFLSDYPDPIMRTVRSQYDLVRRLGEPLLLHYMSSQILDGEAVETVYPAEKLILPLSRGGNAAVDCFLTLNLSLEAKSGRVA